ncbi:MAG TPA: 30S ribosomal protein S20 [Polyangia bacterium]|nr:30S ribosomal protein S20 [Polyangia bacterium]HVZ88129.1 30S ribosomal protein S20 [Polyangia bacterium]
MANIKSAEKANRQRVKRTARNVSQTTAMRTAIKKLRTAMGSKTTKDLAPLLKSAVQAIDKAASKGVIKKGTASRSVSRLTVAVAGLSGK